MAAVYNSVCSERWHESCSLEKMHGWATGDIQTFGRGVMILKNCACFTNQCNNCVVTNFDWQKQDLSRRGNKWVSYSMIAQGWPSWYWWHRRHLDSSSLQKVSYWKERRLGKNLVWLEIDKRELKQLAPPARVESPCSKPPFAQAATSLLWFSFPLLFRVYTPQALR